MKKLSLAAIAMYVGILASYAQDKPAKDTGYKPRRLSFEEANFIGSYYQQDGNHSAVTGGIGTEKLSDYSTAFQLKMHAWDKKKRKHTLDLELGIDHYTSASSDNIDPKTKSSASYADTRIYPSATWTIENEQKGSALVLGGSVSHEFDYDSFGFTAGFSKKTKNKMGEFTARAQVYLDQVKLIYPIELRPGYSPAPGNGHTEDDYASAARNSFSFSGSYSQIVNPRLQWMLLADLIYQQGYIGLPFHRVYFNNATEAVASLPGTRLKIPLGFRINYFAGDRFIFRTYYRYYQDNWGLTAHTANEEISYKISPFTSFTAFYRYYVQSAIDYFSPYGAHEPTQQYYSSNYDLSAFTSHFFGAGIRLIPPKGIFGLEHFNMLELRYGHYTRTTDMVANVVSVNLKFK